VGDEEASQSAGSWWTLGALSLASFLLTLDDTALSVALPAIGRDLGLGLSGLGPVFSPAVWRSARSSAPF